MKRKRLLAMILTAAMAAGLVAGCGNSESTEEPNASDAGESAETSEVTIWYYYETEGHQVAINQVIDDYNESQDTYSVTAEYVPFADFKKQLSVGVSADELPDIVIIDSPDHAAYATM